MSKSSFYLFVLLLIALPASAQIPVVKANESVKNNQLKEVIVNYTMHFDIGYTDLASAVLYNYRTTLADSIIHSMKATSRLPREKQFTWSIPAWPLRYMLENTSPWRRAGLEAAIKSKRLDMLALPFVTETESSSLENLVRGVNLSSTLSRKFNLPAPVEAKMADVPEHSWILPTLLTHAGVKILYLGCNPGSISPDVPHLFWWEGPDGSRLLTFYWDKYYGSGVLPPKDWKYKTWFAMISTNENTGPPSIEDVNKTLEQAKQELPGVKVRMGTLTDFYKAIIKEHPDIPVIRGDMPDTWIHGFMSMPESVETDKYYQHAIYESEALHTLEQAWNIKVYPIRDEVSKAVEQMLLFEEHTFGIAMSHGAGSGFTYGNNFIINRARGFYNRAKMSWREKESYTEKVESIGAMLRSNMLNQLAASTAVNGKRVVVYNSLPWERSGNVTLFMNIYSTGKTVTALKDIRNNKLIPVYNQGNLLQFYAEDVPAMGYTTYIPVFDGERPQVNNGLVLNEGAFLIENKFLKIRLDPNKGTIVSCIDKQSGRELVDTESPYGLGEYFHEYFGKEDLKRYDSAYVKPVAHGWADGEMGRPMKGFNLKYEQACPQKGRWIFQKNEDEIVATYFGELSLHYSQHYTITYVIRPQTPLIELIWNVQDKQAEANPEAGWIALPFKIAQPTFHLGRIGGIVDPAKDLVSRTNHDYFFLNTGLSVTGTSGFGIGLNTPDAPAVSIGRPGLYRFSKAFNPKNSTVFVNLYDTQWGTNFAEWIDGSWSTKMYLWPISHYTSESGLITPMEETRQPLAGCYTDGPAGVLPATMQGIKVSRKGIMVTSFTQMPDGKIYRLRLWEMAGQSGPCVIELPAGKFTTARLCNLINAPIPNEKIISIKNNKLTIQMKAYQPVSLLLK